MKGVIYRPLADPVPSVEISMVWRKDSKAPLLMKFIQEFLDRAPGRPCPG
jgi:DNA-binding transcriptional LysR family regulator